MHAQYAEFHEQLRRHIPEDRLISDPLRTLAYGTDASFYRLIPQLVVRVESETEVQHTIRLAARMHLPITFRAAGTSLSGQAITDSILIQLGDGWNGHHISADAKQISLQPGVIGAQANRWLAPHGRKIGPDPASINAAKIGGIAANNASGMCCGTAQNSYQTLVSMRMILADGTLLDTGDAASVAIFRNTHAHLLEGIRQLSQAALSNSELKQRIEHKYRLKNTTGYALNSLIDFADPIDILQHLMIGSEGTLGFISNITYRTVVEHAHKASALVFFNSVGEACRAVAQLKTQPVAAVELMDRAGIRSVEDKPGMPDTARQLPDTAAALLIETRAEKCSDLHQQIRSIIHCLQPLETAYPVEFSEDAQVCAQLWAIRKGLFPAVGAVRETGTTVIIEDVAFPVERLADAVTDLHQLFQRWQYPEALIFGHALEGNLHFVFTQAFDTAEALSRYEGLMEDVAQLVVHKYDGSLKAEHGTGRNMAPYVELEWGKDAYQLMWSIKRLFDPENLLNPGVILNEDKRVHLANLKPMPAASQRIDTCIECGFCEPQCPSRALTLTPRQRIAVWREIQRLENSQDHPERLQQLKQDYTYQGEETCAACGLCSLSCPVGINTGDLTRDLRQTYHASSPKIAHWTAQHFAQTTQIARTLLSLSDKTRNLLGETRMQFVTQGARKISGDRLPLWLPNLPKGADKIQTGVKPNPGKPQVIYLPSCSSRTFGADPHSPFQESLAQVTERLLLKAGFEVLLPDTLNELCCGMPYRSKGLPELAQVKQDELISTLKQLSQNGNIPIYSDTSPCSLELKSAVAADTQPLRIYDSLEFLTEHVVPNLQIRQAEMTLAVHVTCSTTRMGLGQHLIELAQCCAKQIVLPEEITCCGFAGDKGFNQPELNASSLRNLASAVQTCDLGVSTSRTCEMGLSLHSGVSYQSIVYLLDQQSDPL